MSERSNRAEVRNPILALPEFEALRADPAAAGLVPLLLALQAVCRERAEKAWRTRKPPMAAYWAASGVWVGHIARALKKRGEA